MGESVSSVRRTLYLTYIALCLADSLVAAVGPCDLRRFVHRGVVLSLLTPSSLQRDGLSSSRLFLVRHCVMQHDDRRRTCAPWRPPLDSSTCSQRRGRHRAAPTSLLPFRRPARAAGSRCATASPYMFAYACFVTPVSVLFLSFLNYKKLLAKFCLLISSPDSNSRKYIFFSQKFEFKLIYTAWNI